MVTKLQSPEKSNIIYPDDNGESMSNTTEQFRSIVLIEENLELVFADDPNVFVAGNLLWYPVEGNNKLCQASDVMVVFGRPKGYRGSYQQWLEDNIAPQVVFEIFPPENGLSLMVKMIQKFKFSEQHGVEEYYLYNPEKLDLAGWLRVEGQLQAIEQMDGWVSPRLGVRFQLSETELQMFGPSGEPFMSFVEISRARQEALARAEQAEMLLEQERSRSQALEAQLRQMGLNPDEL